MEKVCEFCKVLRAIVYCEADAAQLCLSCDAKVHSANALSNRHLRSLLCDSCRFRPASLHCSSNNHNIYTCPSCDKALHTTLSEQHQRHPIHSYTGCPSVKDFATLWDLDSNQLITSNTSVYCLEEPGSTKQINNKISGRKQQPIRFLVLQIMELEKLQLNDDQGSNGGCHTSPLVLCNDKNDMSPSSSLTNAAIKKNITEETSTDNTARKQDTVHPGVVKNHPFNGEPFPTAPFTLESLQSSSVEGDSFWQCKIQTNQFSAQNMQDLGVCEDLSHDDFNIPDVDVTFQNYEELFGGEYITNNGICNSSVDREVSPDMCSIIRGLEEEDGAASSYYNMSSGRSDHFGASVGSCMFPYSISQEHHFHDEVDVGQTLTLNTSREDATNTYKDKKKARVNEKKKKKKQHASVSAYVENADVRKRVIEQEVRMQRFRYH